MNSDNKKLRVIVFTHGDVESLLGNLLKLNNVEVAGVFVETQVNRRVYGLREKLRRSIRYEGYAGTAMKGLRGSPGAAVRGAFRRIGLSRANNRWADLREIWACQSISCRTIRQKKRWD